MNRYIKILITVAAATVLTVVAVQAKPSQSAQALFDKLMSATISNDYDAFVEQCDARMAAAITKQMLEGVSQQIGPRAKNGYEVHNLGELNQQGYTVHLWRLRFKDGKDDVLATLSVKEGKAGGFFLK
jgi:hypothetical protein